MVLAFTLPEMPLTQSATLLRPMLVLSERCTSQEFWLDSIAKEVRA